jgi:dihydrofolate synthase/folylpolyglutamate synthase
MSKYQNTLDRLYELQKFGIKLGLNSTEALLERLGNPHHGLPCLHIAGTNGKGSVAAMAEAVLLEAGLKVGVYTSPHLVRFSERFVINGREISQKQVIDLAEQVFDVMDPRETPTFFEVVTAMGFLYFAHEKVDLAIMETGLGGRLDATNVCQPLATVITNIGLEHQDYLGNTLAKIAGEKAGIIKPGVPLAHGVEAGPARKVVEARAAELKAPVLRKGRELRFRRKASGEFSLKGAKWGFRHLTTSLVGRHQAMNACLALGALEILSDAGVPVKPEHFAKALTKVRWPGRLERLPRPGGLPTLWMDGAHNIPAARALIENMDLVKQDRAPLVMVLGIMADKDYTTILGLLTPHADQVVFSRPKYPRAANPEDLAKAAPKKTQYKVEQDLKKAMRLADELAGENGVVLITGSLFTVGEARDILGL